MTKRRDLKRAAGEMLGFRGGHTPDFLTVGSRIELDDPDVPLLWKLVLGTMLHHLTRMSDKEMWKMGDDEIKMKMMSAVLDIVTRESIRSWNEAEVDDD